MLGLSECLAKEYTSSSEILESIEKVIYTKEILCDCPQENDDKLTKEQVRARNSTRITNFQKRFQQLIGPPILSSKRKREQKRAEKIMKNLQLQN